MLDDLRKDSSESAFFQEEDESDLLPKAKSKPKKASTGMGIKKGKNFLGLTAFQRFILSVMLMVATCILGTVLLLVTGKIVPF